MLHFSELLMPVGITSTMRREEDSRGGLNVLYTYDNLGPTFADDLFLLAIGGPSFVEVTWQTVCYACSFQLAPHSTLHCPSCGHLICQRCGSCQPPYRVPLAPDDQHLRELCVSLREICLSQIERLGRSAWVSTWQTSIHRWRYLVYEFDKGHSLVAKEALRDPFNLRPQLDVLFRLIRGLSSDSAPLVLSDSQRDILRRCGYRGYLPGQFSSEQDISLDPPLPF